MSHGRIRTLDVVRGLTMTLVVFHHVRGASFGLYGSPSVISELFVALRMPMFFFISGFVASKAVEQWTARFAFKRMALKARVELVPTVVFFFLFVTLTSWNWTFPGGYWFTVALTAMLSTYYLVSALSRRFFRHYRSAVLMIFAVSLYALLPAVHSAGIATPDINKWFPAGKCCEFFIFFVGGTLCGEDKHGFFGFIGRGAVSTVSLIVATATLSVLHFKKELGLHEVFVSAVSLAGSASVVVAVLAAFWRSREYWNAGGRLSRVMQFVGRRTLDIYMIHWFLLPHIPTMKGLFWHRNNDILELIIIGGLSVAVVVGCLAVSGLLRTSPFLAKWLFAVSLPKSSVVGANKAKAVSVPKITDGRFVLPPSRRSFRDTTKNVPTGHWADIK